MATDGLDEAFEALARRLDASGCSPEEVDRVRADQGVALPWSYECFLRSMGRDAGGLFKGSDLSFGEVRGLRDNAEGLLLENGSAFTLPEDAVVFSMQQGNQFAFLRGSEGRDPTVQLWSEVAEYGDRARVVADSLLDFLEAEDRLWSSRPGYDSDRRATQALRMLAFHREGCPTCGGDLSWHGATRYSTVDADSGRTTMVGACRECEAVFWRWADTPQAQLEPGQGPLP